jgi:hypothetical protein
VTAGEIHLSKGQKLDLWVGRNRGDILQASLIFKHDLKWNYAISFMFPRRAINSRYCLVELSKMGNLRNGNEGEPRGSRRKECLDIVTKGGVVNGMHTAANPPL